MTLYRWEKKVKRSKKGHIYKNKKRIKVEETKERESVPQAS